MTPIDDIDGPNLPGPERKEYVARTSKDELNELAFSPPSQGKSAFTPKEWREIMGGNQVPEEGEDGERALSQSAALIWDLLSPYIASEDPPDLSIDAEAELLTADVLPKVWEIVLAMEGK